MLEIVKVYAIMKFCKFEYNFNGFWLIWSRKTSMLFAVKDSFTAFVYKMRADWILWLVQCFVELLLLWKKNDCSVVWELTWGNVAAICDRLLDVTPHIRCVVSIKEDYCLRKVHFTFQGDSLALLLIMEVFVHHVCCHRIIVSPFPPFTLDQSP